MRKPKSARHQRAANARWRAAEQHARECPAVILPDDLRQPCLLPLSALGWRDVRLEPRLGYVAWRCVDAETREVLHCAASKELLRWIAGQIPRALGARNVIPQGYTAQDEIDAMSAERM